MKRQMNSGNVTAQKPHGQHPAGQAGQPAHPGSHPPATQRPANAPAVATGAPAAATPAPASNGKAKREVKRVTKGDRHQVWIPLFITADEEAAYRIMAKANKSGDEPVDARGFLGEQIQPKVEEVLAGMVKSAGPELEKQKAAKASAGTGKPKKVLSPEEEAAKNKKDVERALALLKKHGIDPVQALGTAQPAGLTA